MKKTCMWLVNGRLINSHLSGCLDTEGQVDKAEKVGGVEAMPHG